MDDDDRKLLNQLLEEKKQRELEEKQRELEKEESMIEEYCIDYVYNHPIVISLINKVVNYVNNKKESSDGNIKEVVSAAFIELDRINLNELIE